MAPPVISTSTFVMVVRMLAVLCSNSPAIAVQLLRQSKFCVYQSLFHYSTSNAGCADFEQTHKEKQLKQSILFSQQAKILDVLCFYFFLILITFYLIYSCIHWKTVSYNIISKNKTAKNYKRSKSNNLQKEIRTS